MDHAAPSLLEWLSKHRWQASAARPDLTDPDAVLVWLREHDPVGEDGKVVRRIAWTRTDACRLLFARRLLDEGRLTP